MTDDRPVLLCNACRKPVYVDEDADGDDPHQCACDDRPPGWRIPDKDEILNRASEWR